MRFPSCTDRKSGQKKPAGRFLLVSARRCLPTNRPNGAQALPSGGTRRRPQSRRSAFLAAVVLTLTALPAAAQPINSPVPNNIAETNLGQVTVFFDRAIDNVVHNTGARARMLAAGRDLWRALALIIIVWTGARVAMTGSFQFWPVVQLVMALAFPLGMLNFYDTPIPGVGLSFPRMLAGGGDWIAGHFAADIVSTMFTELTGMMRNQFVNLEQAWGGLNVWNLLRGGTQILVTGIETTILVFVFSLAMVLAFAIALAQVLYAKLAIAILTALGPLFIPFMMVPKMDFLFWGWFKNFIQYSLYAAIANVMMHVWSAVMLGYITTFAQTGYEFTSGAWMSIWGLTLMVIIVGAISSSFKIGELAAGLIGGSGDGGGFIGGALLASRIVAAPARVAAPAAKGALPT